MHSHLESAEFFFSSGETHFACRQIKEALCCYERAVELGLDANRGALQRWTCYMLLGRFEEAWQETDRTESLRRRLDPCQDHLPVHFRRVWNGQSLENRCVLVRCYHGLGDTIQFSRYIPELKKIARHVIVQCSANIASLISCIEGPDQVVSLENPPAELDFDVDIELMELPYAFRTRLATLPCRIPYVDVPGELTDSVAARLATLEISRGKPRVGVVWQSGTWNTERSISFEQISELTSVEGVNFFSLQRGAEMEGLPFGAQWGAFVHAEDKEANLLRTAAAILNLDLIISVDTMAAHLAGALGKPVWTLLPFAADWRWMLDREDSPWYRSMRLYRQNRPGDWRPVIKRVARHLKGM
jgi:hypothetical protein